MAQPIEGMIPPGGWHFVDNDGVRVPLDGEAENYSKLLRSVMDRRIANRMTVGDVKADVDGYICGNFPSQCGRIETPQPNIPNSGQTRFIDKIAPALTKLHESGVKLVSREIAVQRAEICRQCQQNVEWENSCPSCVDGVRRLSYLMRGGQELGVRGVKACRLHNLPLETACFVRDIPKADGLPNECWNK